MATDSVEWKEKQKKIAEQQTLFGSEEEENDTED